MVTRRVQTRLERKRTGPHEWLVVTRRPLSDEGTLEGQASRDATDQDAHHRYRYYLTPTQTHASVLGVYTTFVQKLSLTYYTHNCLGDSPILFCV